MELENNSVRIEHNFESITPSDICNETEASFNGHLEMLSADVSLYPEVDTNLLTAVYDENNAFVAYCSPETYCQDPCLTSILQELQSFRSVVNEVSELKVSNEDLKRSLDILSLKFNTLERTCLELESTNRRLEREVDLEQAEKENMKRKILQMSSDILKISNESKTANDQVTKTEQDCRVSNETTSSDGAIATQPPAAETGTIELQLQTATSQIAELEKTVDSFMQSFVDLGGKVSWLESELQRFIRRHSIIIENFCPKEDKSASEMFLIFVNSVLEVKTHDSDIDSLHLIDRQGPAGASPQKRPRPILLTFTCYRTRTRIYKAWLAYRSSNSSGLLSSERGQGLSIKEYLTEIQEAVYKEAVKLKEEHLVNDCWTFKGKTYIKTLQGEIKEFHGRDEIVSKDENRSCSIM